MQKTKQMLFFSVYEILLFFACMHVCAVCLCCTGGHEESAPLKLELWTVVNCLMGAWESNQGPLPEQVLLIAEPSLLKPLVMIFFFSSPFSFLFLLLLTSPLTSQASLPSACSVYNLHGISMPCSLPLASYSQSASFSLSSGVSQMLLAFLSLTTTTTKKIPSPIHGAAIVVLSLLHLCLECCIHHWYYIGCL